MKSTTFLSIFIFSLFFIFDNPSIHAQSNLLKRANVLYEQFDYIKAIELYKKVINKDKKNKEAIQKIAHCYRHTSDTRKAEHWYKKAIRYSSEENILKFYYAQALMSNQKYEDALTWFEKYTELSPKDSRGWRFVESCSNIQEYLKDSALYTVQRMPFNSAESDFGPTFFQDGLVFASSRFENSLERRSQWTGESYVDLYFTQPINRTWTPPAKLVGKANVPFHEGPAVFSTDGSLMYFTRNVGKSRAKKTGLVNLKIFQATWNGQKWHQIEALSFNDDDYSSGHPALSFDGKTLYFTSDMPGGFGGKDLYVSYLNHNQWSAPQNLGPNVNTEGDEMFPTIHEDGTLYFSSNGLGGFGSLDIFATIFEDGEWQVTNVGFPINSARDDFGLVLNTDKTYGFLASNRVGSQKRSDDIYSLTAKVAAPVDVVEAIPSPNTSTEVATLKTIIPKAKQEVATSTYPKVVPNRNQQKANPTGLTQHSSDYQNAFTPNQGTRQPTVSVKQRPTPPYPQKLNLTTEMAAATPAKRTHQAPVKANRNTPITNPYRPKSASNYISSAQVYASADEENLGYNYEPTAPTYQSFSYNAEKRTYEKDSIILYGQTTSLVLIGIVLDETTKKPLSGALVELIDENSKAQQTFTTKQDGNFYFKLTPNTQYRLTKLTTQGNVEDIKRISTMGKNDTEILHTILEGNIKSKPNTSLGMNPNDTDLDHLSSPHPVGGKKLTYWQVDDSKPHKNSTEYENPNDDDLTFRIQIGAFKNPKSSSDPYLMQLAGEWKTERTANGFIRYMVGEDYADHYRAHSKLSELRRKGYRDAYIAAYLNGYRLEMPVEKVLETYK